jgi:methylthioxylose transferase
VLTDPVAGARARPGGAYGPPVSAVLTRVEPASPPRRSGLRADLVAGGAALLLVLVALAVGLLTDARLYGSGHFRHAAARFGEYPVLASLLPHVGPGTVLAVMVAVAAIAWGPGLADRLRWRVALPVAYLLAVAWTFALALVDGWQTGVVHRLATSAEYLTEVPGITDIHTMLQTFADRIPGTAPDAWITHVAGHPPGATLVFVWLDRLGLGGSTAAGIFCVLAGALVAVAVPLTVLALGRPELARAALPFVALLPGAVWMGVSADAMFAGVTACGVAALAVGATRLTAGRSAGGLLCAVAGLLLGFGIFLSYGLLLMAPIALAVVLVTRCWRALAYAVPAALAVAAAFALAGFWWLDGYHLVVERYYAGIAADRPYWYWVWANLACLALAVGPATAAGLRRSVPRFLDGLPGRPALDPVTALVRGAALAVLTADLTGLSKAETERIWLPFAVWLVLAAVSLPRSSRRWWLVAQAGTALVVNHVLLTNW